MLANYAKKLKDSFNEILQADKFNHTFNDVIDLIRNYEREYAVKINPMFYYTTIPACGLLVLLAVETMDERKLQAIRNHIAGFPDFLEIPTYFVVGIDLQCRA
jgi:hypothetical protein